VPVRIVNIADQDQVLNEGTVVGHVEPVAWTMPVGDLRFEVFMVMVMPQLCFGFCRHVVLQAHANILEKEALSKKQQRLSYIPTRSTGRLASSSVVHRSFSYTTYRNGNRFSPRIRCLLMGTERAVSSLPSPSTPYPPLSNLLGDSLLVQTIHSNSCL
jgi:hypothetical protein